MRVHAFLLICAVAGIAACGSQPSRGDEGSASTTRRQKEEAIREVARTTTKAAQDRSLTLACNASDAPPQLTHALIVTSRQCYTCDAV
ncbi:MAG TPA: hypothetical protein VF625_05850, partial [Longimicrobium sp.]